MSSHWTGSGQTLPAPVVLGIDRSLRGLRGNLKAFIQPLPRNSVSLPEGTTQPAPERVLATPPLPPHRQPHPPAPERELLMFLTCREQTLEVTHLTTLALSKDTKQRQWAKFLSGEKSCYKGDRWEDFLAAFSNSSQHAEPGPSH